MSIANTGKQQNVTYLFPLLQILPRRLFSLLGRLPIPLARLQRLLLFLLLGSLRRLFLRRGQLSSGRRRRLAVGSSTRSSLAAVLFGESRGFFFLLDALDTRVNGEDSIDELADADVVFLFTAGALGLVFLFGEALVVATID